MTATTASDPSGVQYFFHCLTTGGHDSGWQASATYVDTGLSPNTTYTYQVVTRDNSPSQNQGSYSASAAAATQPPPDTTPPTPNPSTWATGPYATGTTSISMTATTASDPSGVQYFFHCLTSGGHDSGWQASATYVDTGLSPNTTYTYQVVTRDNSPSQNQGSYSASAAAATQPPPDTTPPTPNPSTWATGPYATGTTSISMTATTASDPSGVQYFFHCLTSGGHDSGWQASATYVDTGLSPNTTYTYQVVTRDNSPSQNQGSYSASAAATTQQVANNPRQLSGMAMSNGVFHFVLNGPVGSNYVVKVSTNLVNWVPLSTNTISVEGSLIINDPLAAGQPQRFYRAVLVNGQSVGLADDFDPDIDLAQWSALGGGAMATNYAGYCGVGTGPNSLWFGGFSDRSATTRVLDTTQGGTIGYFVRLADSDELNWDKPELPQEGVVFEYSTDNGGSWVRLVTYDTPAYTKWFYEFMPIPPGAEAVGTLFRWRQLSFSTDRTTQDNWALDEVEIINAPSSRAPVLMEQPRSQVVFAATTPSLHTGAKGSWPLTYRWTCNGTNVPGGTNAMLVLTNVAVSQGGTYVAAISNAYGAVTSSVAVLTVFPVVPLAAALDTPGWVWTTGGNAPWFGQTNITHDGMSAARSGPIWYSDMNWMQATVTGPGTVSFWWKVSSEGCCDSVRFLLGGVERANIAGEVDWQPQSFSISAGSQVLRWEYSKDDSGTVGQDAAWVDQVSFTPTGP